MLFMASVGQREGGWSWRCHLCKLKTKLAETVLERECSAQIMPSRVSSHPDLQVDKSFESKREVGTRAKRCDVTAFCGWPKARAFT